MSIPYDAEEDQYSQCFRWTIDLQHVANSSSSMPDKQNTTMEKCTSWVYSQEVFSSTLVTDLDFVCERQIFTTHANMMTMTGIMVSSFFSGIIADALGRKRTMIVCMFTESICGSAIAFVHSATVLLVLRFFLAAVCISCFMSTFVLCTELVGPSKRGLAGILIQIGWGTGILVLVFFSYLVRDWRNLQLILSAPSILFVSYWWLVPESPRWLLNKGRVEEATKVLVTMAKVNKTELPQEMLPTAVELENPAVAVKDETAPKGSLVLLFRSPVLLLRMLILIVNWAVCSMVYYGLTLNVGSIVEGDLHLNFFVLSMIEMISYIVTILLLDRMGRKILYCSVLLLGGAACLATIVPLLLGKEIALVNMVLSNVGKFGISIAFAIIWLYTAELLPTVIRNSALGACSFGGRVGGILSPYIGNMHYLVGGSVGKALPLAIFGGSALLAGILSLFLPETSGRKLPETIADAEQITRMKKKKYNSKVIDIQGD